MRKKLLLIFFLLFSCLEAQQLKVATKAKSAILINAKTGAILYQKNPHEAWCPASTTKVATALFVLDHKKMPLDTICTASKGVLQILPAEVKQANFDKYASHLLEHDGVKMGLKEGEQLTLDQLMYALMLESANDAANVIAETCCGSVETFMEELNAFLRQKGIIKSRFTNPHGLHHPEFCITAYEMAKIAAWAYENPHFRRYSQTVTFELPQKRLKNFNQLINKEKKYFYPKAIGGKTGYHKRAGFNLVTAAQHEDRTLIAVILGCTANEERYKDAIALFDAAFNEKPLQWKLYDQEQQFTCPEIPHANRPLKAILNKDVSLTFFPSEEIEPKAQLLFSELKLPIQKGDQVGELSITNQYDKEVVRVPLFASETVEKRLFFRCLDKFAILKR